MMVLIVENSPNQLKGRLSLWLFEVKPGVYVGDCNSKLREWIWRSVKQHIGNGSAMIIWSTSRAEFGFRMDSVGVTSRNICNIDGLDLVCFK